MQVGHYYQKGQQGKDDKVFHGGGVGLAAVGVAALVEDKRLVGVAEGLCDERHDHGYLDGGAIDAELYVDLTVHVGRYEGEDNFVGRLVEDAGNAQARMGQE